MHFSILWFSCFKNITWIPIWKKESHRLHDYLSKNVIKWLSMDFSYSIEGNHKISIMNVSVISYLILFYLQNKIWGPDLPYQIHPHTQINQKINWILLIEEESLLIYNIECALFRILYYKIIRLIIPTNQTILITNKSETSNKRIQKLSLIKINIKELDN